MRTRTRIATVIASGVLATALLASPSLAAGQRGGPAPEQTSPDHRTAHQTSPHPCLAPSGETC